MRNNHRTSFTAGHYRVLADIVDGIADPGARKIAADTFATQFRKRYEDGFDPLKWEQLTGGQVRGYDIRKGRFVS